MDEKEYMKRQERLIRKVKKTDKWYCGTPFLYTAYLVPVIFVASQLLKLHWLSKHFDYCLAIRINGEVMPLDIDIHNAILWIVLSVGFVLLLMAWMSVSDWKDKRTFKEILEIDKTGD